jgi:cytochrome P450
MASSDASLSLVRLLEPEVLANPYPLYHKLRSEDPVHWDRFLHTWVVTRYPDVLNVLHSFSADRTPTPEQLTAMGLSGLNPIAKVMVKQMLFMDAPAHTRLRGLASAAFTPRKIEVLRGHIQEIADELLDRVGTRGRMDIIADFAAPMPAIVTAEMLGVPTEDHADLKKWSADFAEMLGNFQHNPDRIPRVLESTNNLTDYFQAAIDRMRQRIGNARSICQVPTASCPFAAIPLNKVCGCKYGPQWLIVRPGSARSMAAASDLRGNRQSGTWLRLRRLCDRCH